MGITKDIPVPTSYRRLTEFKVVFNIHNRLIIVWIAIAFTCWQLLGYLNRIGINSKGIYFIAVVIFIIIFWLFARDVRTLDRQIFHIRLLYRVLKKDNIIKKYVEPLDDLKNIVPIDTVENTGTITYKDRGTGVLIVYTPPRTPDNLLDHHSKMMDMVINSVFAGFTLQFLSNSVLNTSNPLGKSTSESLKNKDLPGQVVKTLKSLHKMSLKKRDSVKWDFAIVVIFPKQKSLKRSERLISAFMPGFMSALSNADLKAKHVEDRTEVIRSLRGFLC